MLLKITQWIAMALCIVMLTGCAKNKYQLIEATNTIESIPNETLVKIIPTPLLRTENIISVVPNKINTKTIQTHPLKTEETITAIPKPLMATIIQKPRLKREDIIKELMSRSLASYSGKCPCPYFRTRRGKCGRRSAYSKPGGASPLCYEHDVSDDMINKYRISHNTK